MSRKKQRPPRPTQPGPTARPVRVRLPAAILLIGIVVLAASSWLLLRGHSPGANAKAEAANPSPGAAATLKPAATIGAAPVQAASAGFVGSGACSGCHAEESTLWQGSQHAKAMQHASADTVLGNFDNAGFDYFDTHSTFYRREGKFFVRTDGADGKLADFEISHVFGVSPLQQYLIAFPDGRLQALSVAWDTRPESAGGQRWLHLYPDTPIRAGDPLHWTRREQNWNWMCAECHSTKLERHFDAASNRYATTFAEMNVACEACHGPGEKHLAWARAGANPAADSTRGLAVRLDERRGVHWTIDPQSGNAARSEPPGPRPELAVCTQCHARRGPFAGGLSHTGDTFETHDLALLTAPLYHADGQQRGEVYNTGSFMSSRMYAKGVTCSDCHEPHSGALLAPGNAVCSQCHLSTKYDTSAHTLHPANSRGAACTACHMPTTDYMVVDARHDHSFRIPRPDLSLALGTPNACNQCHRENDAAWAAGVIEKHYGPVRKGFQSFGPAFHAAEQGAPGAEAGLLAVTRDASASAIARASALARLEPYLSAQSIAAVEAGAADPDPLLRGAAMDTLLAAPAQERVRIAAALIDDPSRIVRIKAARALAIAPDEGMTPDIRKRLQPLFKAYVESQRANADRPEPLINLGLFYADRRDALSAEAAYRQAMQLEPDFVPAYVNLADLYRAYGRDADAESALATGLAKVRGDADLSHAMGLLRIRQGRRTEALDILRQASDAAPQNPRYAFVLGVALHDSGESAKAIETLGSALARFPNDPEILDALVSYTDETGDAASAEAYRKRLEALRADEG
jgi:Flp pilus assembly protein TadD